jgi:hypothetical protein
MKSYFVSLIWVGENNLLTPATFHPIRANSEQEAIEQVIADKCSQELILEGKKLINKVAILLTCLDNMEGALSWNVAQGVVAIKLNTLNQQQFTAFVSFLMAMNLIDSAEIINKIKDIYKTQLEIK